MKRRGLVYVLVLTLLVTFAGAAAMLAVERDAPGGPWLDDYGTAIWWTAMMMTTMGSEHWPHTVEGRVLCVLLAMYAFAIFGYMTAFLASYFIGADAASTGGAVGRPAVDAELRSQIATLSRDLRMLRSERLSRPKPRGRASLR